MIWCSIVPIIIIIIINADSAEATASNCNCNILSKSEMSNFNFGENWWKTNEKCEQNVGIVGFDSMFDLIWIWIFLCILNFLDCVLWIVHVAYAICNKDDFELKFSMFDATFTITVWEAINFQLNLLWLIIHSYDAVYWFYFGFEQLNCLIFPHSISFYIFNSSNTIQCFRKVFERLMADGKIVDMVEIWQLYIVCVWCLIMACWSWKFIAIRDLHWTHRKRISQCSRISNVNWVCAVCSALKRRNKNIDTFKSQPKFFCHYFFFFSFCFRYFSIFLRLESFERFNVENMVLNERHEIKATLETKQILWYSNFEYPKIKFTLFFVCFFFIVVFILFCFHTY